MTRGENWVKLLKIKDSARSSDGQSNGLLIRGSGVRIPPGALPVYDEIARLSGERLIMTDPFEPKACSEIDAKPDLVGWPVQAPSDLGPTSERGIALREFPPKATHRRQRIHERFRTWPFERDAENSFTRATARMARTL